MENKTCVRYGVKRQRTKKREYGQHKRMNGRMQISWLPTSMFSGEWDSTALGRIDVINTEVALGGTKWWWVAGSTLDGWSGHCYEWDASIIKSQVRAYNGVTKRYETGPLENIAHLTHP